MFRSIYITGIPVFVLVIFGLQVIFTSPESYAQGLLRTADDIGGSGSTTQSEAPGNNSSTLLIVGGVIIAGLLFYTLVIDKNKNKKEEKQDSTSQGSLLLRNPTDILSGATSRHSEMTADIPVNIYLGFQNFNPVLCEKKFIVGITCNF